MSNTKILIVAPAWIGDLVMSIALLNALKEINKDVNIDLLVNENLYDLAQCLPNVSKLIVSKTRHGKLSLFYRIKLGLKLRGKKYSECYILSNSFKSSITPFVAKIKKRIGYLGEFRYGLINKVVKTIDRKEGMVNRYLNLINRRYQPRLKPRIMSTVSKNSLNHKFGLKRDYVVFCPDAEFGPAKKWPIHKWIDLAKTISDKHQVVFVGLDKSISKYIQELGGSNISDLIGETSITDALDIIRLSSCVVSNDSGLMHVAAALDKPVVGIYGSSSPVYTPPLLSDEKKITLYESLSCSPCFQKTCPLGHMNCLNNITIDNVKNSILQLVK